MIAQREVTQKRDRTHCVAYEARRQSSFVAAESARNIQHDFSRKEWEKGSPLPF